MLCKSGSGLKFVTWQDVQERAQLGPPSTAASSVCSPTELDAGKRSGKLH